MTALMQRLLADRREALPIDLERKMGRLFGADFSDVRIAESPIPAEHGTIAVAYGDEVRFSPGVIGGWSGHAERILAHELTHVLQHRSGRIEATGGEFEREARRSECEQRPRPRFQSEFDLASPTPVMRSYTIGTAAMLGLLVPPHAATGQNLAQLRNGQPSFRAVDGRVRTESMPTSQATYRFSENRKFLLEHCNDNNERQAKVFFATLQTIAETNNALQPFALQFVGARPHASLVDQNNGKGLFQVQPVNTVTNNGLRTFIAPQSCKAFAHHCVGLGSPDIIAKLAQLAGLALPANPNLHERSQLAAAVCEQGLAANTVLMSAVGNKLNEYADPRVGDGFDSTSLAGFAVGADPQKHWLTYDFSIPQQNREIQTRRLYRGSPREVNTTWGDHLGLVAARDGQDALVLQNYSRLAEDVTQTDESPEDDPYSYFQMYRIPPGAAVTPNEMAQTWHSQWNGMNRVLRGVSHPGEIRRQGQPEVRAPFGQPPWPIRQYIVQDRFRVLINHFTAVARNGANP